MPYELYQEPQQCAGAMPRSTYYLRLWPICELMFVSVGSRDTASFSLCSPGGTCLSVTALCFMLCCWHQVFLYVPQADSKAPFFCEHVSEFTRRKNKTESPNKAKSHQPTNQQQPNNKKKKTLNCKTA